MDHWIQERLIALADEHYRLFAARLLPDGCRLLGVRLPALRKIAKEIARGDWRAFLACAPHTVFEETMLHGMVLGYIRTGIEERLLYIADFIPWIDNWSVCDSFCSGLKFTRECKESVWAFLQPYLSSSKEFEARFGIVMLLQYYIDAQHIQQVLQTLKEIAPSGYYAKMAAAWAISLCYVGFPEETYAFLKSNIPDVFIYQKSLQKILESKQIGGEEKQRIRELKNNG